VSLLSGLSQFIHDIAERLRQVLQLKVRWQSVDQKCFLAELTEPDAEFVQRLHIPLQERRVVRIDSSANGNNSFCDVGQVACQVLQHLFKQHAFVRGVLVDQHQSFRRFRQRVELPDHAKDPPSALVV